MTAAATPPVSAPAAISSTNRWDAVFAALLRREGTKFTDDPSDRGGATRYGLTLRFVAQCCKIDPALIKTFDINHDGQVDTPDIRNMEIAPAKGLYESEFWRKTGIYCLPAPLDDAVFDQAVNDGVTPAVKMLQAACNQVEKARAGYQPLRVDGGLGLLTRACVSSIFRHGEGALLLGAYRTAARDRYVAIVAADPSQRPFLAGWLARTERLGNV